MRFPYLASHPGFEPHFGECFQPPAYSTWHVPPEAEGAKVVHAKTEGAKTESGAQPGAGN